MFELAVGKRKDVLPEKPCIVVLIIEVAFFKRSLVGTVDDRLDSRDRARRWISVGRRMRAR